MTDFFSDLEIGDSVLLKKLKTNQMCITYEIEPFTITSLKGNQAIIKRGSQTLTRNISLLKKFHTSFQQQMLEKRASSRPKMTVTFAPTQFPSEVEIVSNQNTPQVQDEVEISNRNASPLSANPATDNSTNSPLQNSCEERYPILESASDIELYLDTLTDQERESSETLRDTSQNAFETRLNIMMNIRIDVHYFNIKCPGDVVSCKEQI